MCQLKKNGGRCSAHQPGYLGLKILNVESFDLDQQQVHHTYTVLRTRGKDMPKPSVEEYERFIQEQKEQINNSDLDSKNKKRIFTQLNKTLTEEQLPDGATFYALQHLTDASHNQEKRIKKTLQKFANERGFSMAKTESIYRQTLEETVSSPRHKKVRSVLDERTRRVFIAMHNQHRRKVEDHPRITQEPMSRRSAITEAGYDPEDGRLEVTVNGMSYAYRNVSEDQWREFKNAPMRTFQSIRRDEQYQYASKKEAQQDAYRIYCEECKEFRLASGHVCKPQHTYDSSFKSIIQQLEKKSHKQGDTGVRCPDWHTAWEKRPHRDGTNIPANAVKDDVENGQIVNLTLQHKTKDAYTVEGRFIVGKATPNHVTMMADGVKCPCPAYRRNGECEHTREASAAFQAYYEDLDLDSARQNPNFEFPYDAYAYRGSVPFKMDASGLTEDIKKDIYFVTSRENRQAILYLDEKRLKEDTEVTGALTVSIQNGSLQVYSQSLCRKCGELDCEHIQRLTDKYQDEIEDAVFTPSKRLAELQAMETNNFIVTEPDSAPEDTSTKYTKNLDAYLEKVRSYESAVQRGENILEFREESVTNGRLSSTTGQGKGFGVEIEYAVENEQQAARIREEIASSLMESGLSRDNEVYDYGMSSLMTDYVDWAVEDDQSVAGEVISPILYDNEESWKQITTVCDIIKKHGGTIDENCGQHVHIGINHRTTTKANIMGIVKEHQDSIRRAGTNPDRKKHRNSQYTMPQDTHTMQSLSYVMSGSNDVMRELEVWGERDRTVNVSNSDTAEFRDADGSLNPAHIQAQVMIAAAVVHKAEQEKEFVERDGNPVGLNKKRTKLLTRNQNRELTDEELIVSDVNYRAMIDDLFTDDRSKDNMIRLAVMSPWQQGIE